MFIGQCLSRDHELRHFSQRTPDLPELVKQQENANWMIWIHKKPSPGKSRLTLTLIMLIAVMHLLTVLPQFHLLPEVVDQLFFHDSDGNSWSRLKVASASITVAFSGWTNAISVLLRDLFPKSRYFFPQFSDDAWGFKEKKIVKGWSKKKSYRS